MRSDSEHSRPSRLRTGTWILLFLLGVAGWLVVLLLGEPLRAWQALLVNFLFWTSMAGALVVLSALIVVSRGKWMGPLEAHTLAGLSFALPSLLVLGLLWAGSSAWAPWYGKSNLPQGSWLNNSFLFGRDLFALGLFWLVAYIYYRKRLQHKGRTAGGWLIGIYILSFTLLASDLIMSLDIHWYSTMFGGYVVATALFIATSAWAFMATLRSEVDSNRLHNIASLMVMFCILTTYFMYCQLLTIWFENLPHETEFIVPRYNYEPGKWVSWALVGAVYLGPAVVLMPRMVKDSPRLLRLVALLVLGGLWLERWWLVMFSFSKHPPFGLAEIASIVAFIGLMGFTLDRGIRKTPALTEEAESSEE